MEKRILLLILSFFLLAFTSTAQNQNPEEKKMTIFPNPASEYLQISLHSDLSVPPEIKIIDLTGKLIMKFDKQNFQKKENFQLEIDISNLKSGIYFIKVLQSGKTFTEKLVVR